MVENMQVLESDRAEWFPAPLLPWILSVGPQNHFLPFCLFLCLSCESLLGTLVSCLETFCGSSDLQDEAQISSPVVKIIHSLATDYFSEFPFYYFPV